MSLTHLDPITLPLDERRGPKSTITRETVDEIVRLVGQGLPKAGAAVLCGVYRQLFQRWLEAGRKALEIPESERHPVDALYAELAIRTDDAVTAYQAKLLALLHQATTDKSINEKVLKYLISVRFPHDFQHQPQTLEASSAAPGKGGVFETVTPEEATAAVAAKLAEYVAQAKPVPDAESKPGELSMPPTELGEVDRAR